MLLVLIVYKTIKGKHKIKAIATDNLGLKGTSKEDSILVENNQFPIVTINSPKTAISGDEVTFTASAEDKDGTIVQVEFFVDNASIGIVANAPLSTMDALHINTYASGYQKDDSIIEVPLLDVSKKNNSPM